MLEVAYGQASEAGRVWPRNADAVGAFVPRSRQEVRAKGWMFAVADGRVATGLGSLASSRAVESMVESFEGAVEGVSLASLMPRIVQDANTAVHDEGLNAQTRGKGLTTTIVACALRYDIAVVSHVGDSRCYQVRDGQVSLLTQDHTWVMDQTRAGAMTAAKAESSERRHDLTRSLGPELAVAPEIRVIPIRSGDLLILCTDGLYEAMYPEDIGRIGSEYREPTAIARELVRYALQADGSDNVTAQVISIRAVDAAAAVRSGVRKNGRP